MTTNLHVSNKEDVRSKLDGYIQLICHNKNDRFRTRKKPGSQKQNKRPPDINAPRNVKRRYFYKIAQNEFKQNTRLLAEAIIDDKPSSI